MADHLAAFRLETPRLVLRDWRDGDWPHFVRHTNTPGVMRWLGGVADREAQDAARHRIEACRRDHGHTFWVVERFADGGHLSGQMLGFCGLKRANQPGGPIGDFEIGWRLRADAWGRGYAREAAEGTLGAAFGQFGAPEVIALTVEGNVASWGLMRGLGMVRRPDLDFHSPDFEAIGGTVIAYAMDRQEWAAR